MVSPSKHQHQQQYKQPSRENRIDPRRSSHVRIQKGLKPLEKKSFYLDLKNHAVATKLETHIRELGGAIEVFLVRSVSIVVSDRVDETGNANPGRPRWTSGGSGGPRSLRSIEVPTPTPTPPTPLLSSECPLSNSTNLRGPTAQRSKSRVDAMLERALTQPLQCSVDPLDNAQSWGIPIWTTDKFLDWLEKKIFYASVLRDNLKQLKQANQHGTRKDLRIRRLRDPYVKFESVRRTTRPVFLELSSWPTLNFDGDPGSCPFDTRKQGKEMTRRSRTTAARARRTEQLVAGYCEICRKHYDDVSKHAQSEQHLNFVGNDDNFLSLDRLINAGANVEAFLKLNRTTDIEKNCDLFPSGEKQQNALSDEKVGKNAKSLSNFSVEEIKMVNGARRNLNLRLSSSHNLRARAKHESGHLLRSKGSPWHEVDKSEKLYDKLEGFTIKKRAKGTIWIEEDDPDEKYAEDILKEPSQEDYKIRPFSKNIEEIYNNKQDNINSTQSNSDPPVLHPELVHNNTQNGFIKSRHVSEDSDNLKNRDDECNGNGNARALEYSIKENSATDNNLTGSYKSCKDNTLQKDCVLQAEKITIDCGKLSDNTNEIVCNGHSDKNEQNDASKASQGINNRQLKLSRHPRINRRGGRNIRGRCYRHRLSVEERLIEDNRAYYKVEVLGNKLRSSAVASGNTQQATSKEDDGEEKKEAPSSEKPVVVRFKRVRKSELSLLSDEAESFMFGEPRRDDSSERTSDSEQSSVLPRDTESSEVNENANLTVLLSSPLNSSPVKQEMIEEDSQDSVQRARKRRRTQAEAFIKDNTDYYKFETPGSRLRYQAPITGIKDDEKHAAMKRSSQETKESGPPQQNDTPAEIYPSKPSAEIEKMQFSFEVIPKSEPWYQTYQRQDTGTEFWHCFSEWDSMKPFLLPYEIENFQETLLRAQNRVEGIRKRGRGRGIGCVGRSPRKSPRCHASTLAIMSTIIRKREQQQSSNLCAIEDSAVLASRVTNTPKMEQKQDIKSDVDDDLKEMAKTIDEMLSTKMSELDDSFEPDLDLTQIDSFCGTSLTKGPPPNLLELLDNCQDVTTNCLENNSSCASSECGEATVDIPLKRRKRRKNRTGWPIGNKIKKKVQINNKTLTDCNRDSLPGKRMMCSNSSFAEQRTLNDTSQRLSEGTDTYAATKSSTNITLSTVAERLNNEQKKDVEALTETCTSHKPYHETLAKRDKNVLEINDEKTIGYVESSISESTCDDSTKKNHLSNKDYSCRKDLSEIEEITENDSCNNENHENRKSSPPLGRKDVVNAITERNNVVAKSLPVRKQRQREHVAAAVDSCESRDTEIENQDNLQLQCRKDVESDIVPKKHHNSNSELSSTKRQLRGGNCEENTSGTDELMKRHRIVFAATKRGRIGSRRRIYSRKRQSRTAVARNNLSSSDHAVVYDDENCKKDTYLNITSCNNKKQSLPGSEVRGSVKRKSEAISSSDNIQEPSDPTVDQCALTERVSPSVLSSADLEQRRSSIEFQPVVRMMKLDDQVDMDHSILSSVSVASNRRLRSSGGSPRSNSKPPKKRVKSGRGHFRRWLKNS
ncbi:uncharacterized protein LOC109863669 isoform X2 [Pseudomyrmex gracilis]|uniref:uncharacterized protein LOC109863669 isoform X2 n=1 Tax=Pseudomyrmex gracilis TaxID=219809 RepID=UPI000994A0D0|nr:uncharacterized protein LOC109863669 isoform X2 [Pseudomyrmex gracilis]